MSTSMLEEDSERINIIGLITSHFYHYEYKCKYMNAHTHMHANKYANIPNWEEVVSKKLLALRISKVISLKSIIEHINDTCIA